MSEIANSKGKVTISQRASRRPLSVFQFETLVVSDTAFSFWHTQHLALKGLKGKEDNFDGFGEFAKIAKDSCSQKTKLFFNCCKFFSIN